MQFDFRCAFCTQSIETADWVFVNEISTRCTHVGHASCHESARFAEERDGLPEKCPTEGCTALVDDLRSCGIVFIDYWGVKFGGCQLEGYFLERLQWGVNRYWKL